MDQELTDAIADIESRDSTRLLNAVSNIEGLILQNAKEFTAKQDLFTYNIAGRLSLQLEQALHPEYPESSCIAFLRLLRGLCLLHRPSRQVFNNDEALNVILGSLKNRSPQVQVAVIETLVSILVRQVECIRRFEQLKGLKLVCDVFKQSRTTTAVKLAILQFLFFYLIPETKVPDNSQAVQRKTTQDKQAMLGKYLSNVDGLVRELEMNKPFGQSEIEW